MDCGEESAGEEVRKVEIGCVGSAQAFGPSSLSASEVNKERQAWRDGLTFDMEGYWLILRVARCVGVIVCLGGCVYGVLADLEIRNTCQK